jgi:hypothetical protein
MPDVTKRSKRVPNARAGDPGPGRGRLPYTAVCWISAVTCVILAALYPLSFGYRLYLRVADHRELSLVGGAVCLETSVTTTPSTPHWSVPRPWFQVFKVPANERCLEPIP